MESMKLYMFPVAPNPTKVRLFIAEKRALGSSVEVEEITVNLPKGEVKEEAQLARNPFGTLPVLEMRDGSHLWESLPIIDYLDDAFPNPSIWGEDAESRALARQAERIADLGVLYPIARIVHATESPLGYPPNPTIAENFRVFLKPRMAYFEERLADGRPFLLGDRPSVVDCTLAAGFQFGRFRKMDFSADYPALASWDAAYRKREEVASVLSL